MLPTSEKSIRGAIAREEAKIEHLERQRDSIELAEFKSVISLHAD